MSRPSFSAPTIASSLVLAALVSVNSAAARPGLLHEPYSAQADLQQQPQTAQQPVADAFRQILEQYGTFQMHARYGEVWIPNPQVTGAGWRPYPECMWVYQRAERSWYFNDQTEWGNIVHHYGRWANDPGLGWIWVADATHGPGWVHWHFDTQTVSWAAMLPPQDADQQPAAEAWHSQDVNAFNTSCQQQQQQPPPPAASAPPRAPGVAVLPPPLVVVRPPVIVRPPIGGPVVGLVRPPIVTGWVRPPIATHLHIRRPVRYPGIIRPPIRVRPTVVAGLRPPLVRPPFVRPAFVRPAVYRPPAIRTVRIAPRPAFRAPVNRPVFRVPVRVNRPVYRAPIARMAPRVSFAPRTMARPAFSAPRRFAGRRR